jgi:hypothetical protein
MLTNRKLKSNIVSMLTLLTAGLALAACSSMSRDTARSKIGGAQSALTLARDKNANQHAPLELKLAEEKLSRSDAAFRGNDYEKSARLAEEALADAQLAEAKSESSETDKLVRSLKDSISDLRREINRTKTGYN